VQKNGILSPRKSIMFDDDRMSADRSVDVEVRKRTMWAIYCLHISSSTTYGRPPMMNLADLGKRANYSLGVALAHS